MLKNQLINNFAREYYKSGKEVEEDGKMDKKENAHSSNADCFAVK